MRSHDQTRHPTIDHTIDPVGYAEQELARIKQDHKQRVQEFQPPMPANLTENERRQMGLPVELERTENDGLATIGTGADRAGRLPQGKP